MGGHDEHPPHLAHHFDTSEQQFDACKLGMWLFLVTEVLLFGGMFCAYAVYRANHPEIFYYVYKMNFLSVTLGGINTIVLLVSSLTMAMAVRCAQCRQPRGVIAFLVVTILCGFGFMGIKAVEYQSKWKHGLLWGTKYDPHQNEHGHADHAADAAQAEASATGHAAAVGDEAAAKAEEAVPAAGTPTVPGEERSTIAPSAVGPGGLVDPTGAADRDEHHAVPADAPHNVHIFFGIYFSMTGLHGLHVLAGMAVLTWLLVRAVRGDFSKGYFTPVDLGGLYWHLVDLIWIFLFPLLYLIH
jgi:cytochrome c oxidase subunit 3